MLMALHGFLGLPNDWQSLQIPALRTYSLWNDLATIPAPPVWRCSIGDNRSRPGVPQSAFDLAFDLWARRFNQTISQWSAHTGSRPVVMGYSLGGRLLMHAVAARPKLYRGCIYVSAHPGLPESDESDTRDREQRFRHDCAWAHCFLSQPWDDTVAAWNAQNVLAPPPGASASAGLPRRECDFDRRLLANALIYWSLARQRNLRTEACVRPTLLITGAHDRKFTALTRNWVRSQSRARHIEIAGAGHRVPWDRPKAFTATVRHWIRTL